MCMYMCVLQLFEITLLKTSLIILILLGVLPCSHSFIDLETCTVKWGKDADLRHNIFYCQWGFWTISIPYNMAICNNSYL